VLGVVLSCDLSFWVCYLLARTSQCSVAVLSCDLSHCVVSSCDLSCWVLFYPVICHFGCVICLPGLHSVWWQSCPVIYHIVLFHPVICRVGCVRTSRCSVEVCLWLTPGRSARLIDSYVLLGISDGFTFFQCTGAVHFLDGVDVLQTRGSPSQH